MLVTFSPLVAMPGGRRASSLKPNQRTDSTQNFIWRPNWRTGYPKVFFEDQTGGQAAPKVFLETKLTNRLHQNFTLAVNWRTDYQKNFCGKLFCCAKSHDVIVRQRECFRCTTFTIFGMLNTQ